MIFQRLRSSYSTARLWLLFAALLVAGATKAQEQIVISQVYGGGGNAGAPYKNDFIELFNRGTAAVNLDGWSVQYAASGGTSWQATRLSGTIQPGGYYLVQEGAGTNTTLPGLPMPDATGGINMSGTAGKVALVKATSVLSGSCPVVNDFVGFGTATNCSETAPTANLTNSTAAVRAGNGCTDTGNNSADFTIGTPSPRNSASPTNLCNSTAPTIAATPNPVSLSYAEGSGPATRIITTNATNLTSASGGITVTVSNPAFAVSYNGSSFGNSVTIPYTNSGLSSTTLAAQLTAGLVPNSYSGSITFSGGGATVDLPVTGVVSASVSTGIVSIAAARTGIGNTYTVQGRVTVTNQLGARQIYIQDETGGIVVYASPSGTDISSLVQIGDLVQARGPVTVFNGFTEITSPAATNFTLVSGAGTVVPAPIEITPDQLPNYQGRLVSISNASISGSGATFVGGTSYTITKDNQSATLRISANSPLAGAGRPSNPVSVTGIADRFVSGVTTPGNNGLQLQPRILADIPGSTAAQDAICGPAENTALPRTQTLDVAAWNMEFFGADGGSINCPRGTYTYEDMGPVNEDLQQVNATAVLTKLNADIISVEEISDINRFSATVAAIPGSYSYVCSDKFSYFFQDQCDQQVTNGTVFGPTSLAQKVCVIYNTATVTPVLSETKPLLLDKYNYPSGNGWSSGRLPFLFVADATINGVTRRIHVVTVHAKSGSAAGDFNRRRQDFADLKTLLDTEYATANIVMMGDYNDKATSSIYTSSPVSSFNNFVSDEAGYKTVTKPLEQQGCSTFNSSASFIDHMIVSNDLAAGYIDNSAYVLLPFSIPNYGNTTSDHNPIFARFDLSKLAVTVVKALSRDPDNGQLNSNTLKPYLTLQNQGTTSVDYSTITVRYWLNVEDNMDLIFQKNYVAIGQNNLNLRYVSTPGRQGATGYIEYSFSPGAGSLAPMSESGPIEIQVYKQNYSAFNQAGDYSYVNNSAFGLNNRITVYQGGSLIYGVEPARTNAARLGAEEAGATLQLNVLGNPVVNESVEVEIRGAAGQRLQLRTIDNRGRSVNTTIIEHAAAVERATISVGKSTGVYLLQATTATQKQVVKLVKE
ncbi:lamin tail domain-containing protein [Spirosoma sp. RP8]|uniref:Lamin tail domain-containing protein n=1 Tax=Spirosoma liriopis TaxID=2937440 RepID=A0ABT0HP67_9BACT|nr:lamin tail domain-containing protein [Spirosoma liriopis]MCK8493340.1 lamin tail domain-containing protein [Spirosoma liriopis]